MGIIKYLYLIMSKAQYAVCTTKADCSTASSCCTAFAPSASGSAGSVLACWNPGSAAGSSGVITPTQTAGTVDSDNKGYLLTACAAATTGASTLAVSAATVATAVYMM